MPNETVLIVDDNPTNLKLVRIILEDAGYDVHCAINAATTLQILETLRPRVILMDIQLPDIDGHELTRMIKQDPRHADIVIVAVTAYAMKGDRAKALAAGCDEYVSKPIDVDGLPRTVARMLLKG